MTTFTHSEIMSSVFPTSLIQDHVLISKEKANKMKESAKSLSKIKLSRVSFFLNDFQNHFWREFVRQTIFPHFLASFVVFIFFLLKEKFLIQLCWLTKGECPHCSREIKYLYLYTLVSLEYIIPITVPYFMVFSSIKSKKLSLLTKSYFISSYIIMYIWYMIWDFNILILFDAPTPDFLVYISVSMMSFLFLPRNLKENKINWKNFKGRFYFNGFLVIFLGSCTTFLSIMVSSVSDLLRNYDDNAFQYFILFFSTIFEEICLWFCVKNYHYNHKDWNGSNLTIAFYAKLLFLSIFSFRIANFSSVSYLKSSFYFHILSFLSFFIEILTGKSILSRISLLARRIWIKWRKCKNKCIKFQKNTVSSINLRQTCLKLIGYQKFDIMFIYMPRLLCLFITKKWSISQPAAEVTDGCYSSIPMMKFDYNNIILIMILDLLFSLTFVQLAKCKIINLQFVYQTEKISFFYKVLLYIGIELYFEYMLMYYLTLNTYK